MVNSYNSQIVDLTEDGDELSDNEVNLLNTFAGRAFDSEDDFEASIIVSNDDTDFNSPHSQELLKTGEYQPHLSSKYPLRNGLIPYPSEVLSHWPELDLRPGKVVELKPDIDKDGDFLRIQDIILDPTKESDNIALRGQLLRRAKYVGGITGGQRLGEQTVAVKMKRDLNELSLIFTVDHDDPREPENQAMVTCALTDVLCVRKVIFTHEDFPRRSFRETSILNRHSPDYQLQKQIIKETGVLVCRHAFTEYYKDRQVRLSKRKCLEASLQRLWPKHSDFPSIEQSASEDQSTDRNKGAKINKRIRVHGPIVNHKTKITYGTGCCGAGGDALGAKWAGAEIKYGWDHHLSACQSFQKNHPQAKVYHREAEEFPQPGEDASCDILHLSWPCDFFSPNHTHEGKNDDDNIRAMFGTYEKLKSARPRIHTQENTSGIFSHHPEFFGALIQEIIRAGYNVRWKVDQFADFGLPASRKRLVLIAARIGIPLPEFPKAIHGEPGSGLLRYRTVHDAISKIPAHATWHLDSISPYRTPKPAYSSYTAKGACITRDGGKMPHPSGLRPFTPREMNNLQGFPVHYQYIGTGLTDVKTQIGNAIPPNVWMHYIKSCVDILEKFDAGLIDETGRPVEPRIIEQGFSNVFASLSNSRNTTSRSAGSNFGAWPERSHTPSPEPVSQIFFKSCPRKSSRLKSNHGMIDLTEEDAEKEMIDLTLV